MKQNPINKMPIKGSEGRSPEKCFILFDFCKFDNTPNISKPNGSLQKQQD